MTGKGGDQRRRDEVKGHGSPLLMERLTLLKTIGKAALNVGVMC